MHKCEKQGLRKKGKKSETVQLDVQTDRRRHAEVDL